MKHAVRIAALGIVMVGCLAWAPRGASAECPKSGSPSRAVCKYSQALLMPSGAGRLYIPGKSGLGPWFGGGIQLVLFTWSDNSDRFGPGQGKLFFDTSILTSGEDDASRMVMYRGGINLSIERNASRNWLIPYYGFGIGGMHERTLEGHAFVEGLAGIHAIYTPRLILDIEGGYLFPFSDADTLAGATAQATLSVSLW